MVFIGFKSHRGSFLQEKKLYLIETINLNSLLHFYRKCKSLLEYFKYDGIVLNLENVELHEVFFSGQKYRVVVSKDDFLPPIQFQLLNSNFEVLFDNKVGGYNKETILNWMSYKP